MKTSSSSFKLKIVKIDLNILGQAATPIFSSPAATSMALKSFYHCVVEPSAQKHGVVRVNQPILNLGDPIGRKCLHVSYMP